MPDEMMFQPTQFSYTKVGQFLKHFFNIKPLNSEEWERMKINDFDFNISFFFSKNKSFFPKIFQANFTLFRFYNVQTKYPIVISIKYRIDYMSRRTILTKKLQFLNFFAILLMQFHYRRLTFLQLFLFWHEKWWWLHCLFSSQKVLTIKVALWYFFKVNNPTFQV